MAPQDKLMNEQSLQNDESRVSSCGKFSARMQSDGNFVIYKAFGTPQ
jgi:hypothetical protein